MTKIATMPVYGENRSKIFFAGTAEPMATKLDIVAIKTSVLQCVYKSWPCKDLDRFYSKVNIGHICRKLLK